MHPEHDERSFRRHAIYIVFPETPENRSLFAPSRTFHRERRLDRTRNPLPLFLDIGDFIDLLKDVSSRMELAYDRNTTARGKEPATKRTGNIRHSLGSIHGILQRSALI